MLSTYSKMIKENRATSVKKYTENYGEKVRDELQLDKEQWKSKKKKTPKGRKTREQPRVVHAQWPM